VHVGLGLARDVEVDDETDAVDVEPAGGDVGGDEDVERSRSTMRSRSFCATSPEMVAAETPRSTSAAPTSSAAARVRVKTIVASASDVASTRTRAPTLWRNGTIA
jgi:hypothetical protein